MNLVEVYVGFHPRADWRRDFWASLGHVECWGYTQDETWVFIDPQRVGTRVTALHRLEEVENALTARFARCELILRLTPAHDFAMPLLGPFCCVTSVAAVAGIRAWTLGGLRRRLLAAGAEVVHARPEGRSRGQEGAAA